jgi:subtilisin family serine protease
MTWHVGIDMNTINMSIGAPTGYKSGPVLILADRLASKGVLVTLSAGNDGAEATLACECWSKICFGKKT